MISQKEGEFLGEGINPHCRGVASELAKSYQNVTFLGVAGTTAGPSNYANLWVRFYQPAYLANHTPAQEER